MSRSVALARLPATARCSPIDDHHFLEESTVDAVRMAAVLTVTLALALYTIGTVRQQRSRRSTSAVRGWLTSGVVFDVTATALMIVASKSVAPTLHGVLGYSALAFMLTDTSLLWRHARAHGQAEVPGPLHVFSRVAYGYWVMAYFTGAALVMAERAAG
jgi:hypothetical protein